MAETAITAVLSKLGELATREAALLLKVGDDSMLLRDRLEWLQAFIRDADRKRRVGADDLTRVWIRQTRDVAFQAEDALDDFFHKVDLVSQKYGGWKMVLKYLTGFRTQITDRHGLSGRINRIKSRLDQISENQKEYKIDYSPPGIWTSSTTALAPWDELKQVVGFEKDQMTIHDLLLQNVYFPQKISLPTHCPQKMFISILGDSGVGKKTLMKKIWKEDAAMQSFEVTVWYNMPPDSSMEDVLEQLYKKASIQIQQQNEGIDIVDKLRGVLTGKRYLVVLGGISSKTILNCVGACFPEDQNGSRVILILEPESEEVARHADTLNLDNTDVTRIHRLSRLDEDTSGHLFRTRVFVAKEGDAKDIKLERYEKYVYDITEGHPLAIVVLAGLLRHKEKPVEWDAVLQQLGPGMEGAEDAQDNPVKGVLLLKDKSVEWKALEQPMAPPRETKLSNRMVIERIFSASFDDLHQDLKSCFLYFAGYPNNVPFSADQIVRMWTAEGFIEPQKGRTLEELGHSYLKELVSRCLVVLNRKNARGGIESVFVHNRLLGFLRSEAREASFIEVHDRNDILAPASVRRLSIQNDSGTYTAFTNKFPKLRSFICRVAAQSQSSDKPVESKKPRKITCGNPKLLSCVISGPARDGEGGSNLERVSTRHDLKFLCRSKFLRLISVRGLRLLELPNEIGDMIHLRYLRVESPELDKLPRSIRRLLNLQTLDISKTKVDKIHPDFWKIKTLRHVLANMLMLPVSIVEELADLQTLHGVKAAEGKWDKGSSALDKMTNLRSLELHCFNAAKHESALEGALTNMHLLGHLKLEGDAIPSWLFTGPILRCLQTMELEFPAKCPDVKWDDLSMVRPNLAELTLLNDMGDKLRLLKERNFLACPAN